MTDYIKGWQCIGCGKVDAPANCIGICQDRRVELVDARDHEATLAALAQARAERDVALSLLRRIVRTTPRPERFEAGFRAFQDEARRCIAGLPTPHAAAPSRAAGPPGRTTPAARSDASLAAAR